MNHIHIVTAQNVTLKIELANIGDRFVAAIIDMLIKFGLFMGLILMASQLDKGFHAWWLWAILGIIIYCFYTLLFETFMRGQTPGKRIMKIRVARLDGQPVTFGSLLLRWLFRLVDFWLSPIIGIVTIVATEKNQRVGDLVAGTILVSSRERTNLENTFYREIEPGYTQVFANAEQLSAREAEIIQEVLTLYDTRDKYELVPQLATRIKEKLQIEPPMDDLAFLRTLLKDYNHASAAPATFAATTQTTSEKPADYSIYMPPSPPVQ